MTLPRVLLAVLVTLAVTAGVATVTALVRSSRNEPVVAGESRTSALVASRPEVRAAAVLAAWDRERAAAWASGDVRRLRGLYTPGSVAGHHDRAMLRSWLARGLLVEGLQTQVLGLRELSRSRGRWVLRVTDRVAAGTAVGRSVRQPLPRDSATTSTVTLRRVSGEWLVASVLPAR